MLQDLKNVLQECGSGCIFLFMFINYTEYLSYKEEEFHIQLDKYNEDIKFRKTEISKLMEEHRQINRKLDEKYQPDLIALKRRITSLENIPERKLTVTSACVSILREYIQF